MNNTTILLVEDDSSDVFFLKRAMKLAGMVNPVQVALDGRRAIDYLGGTGEYGDRSQFPLPELILLDLKLPLVMGLDVLKWIREQPELQAVIVIVLTSSNLPRDISRAYVLGANSYLVKPTVPAELCAMVMMIKNYWLQMNRSAPAVESVSYPVSAALLSAAASVPGDSAR